MSKRAQFVTKTGAIAATVGSAVGLGNIWRFPYEAGVHGGGAFLLVYLVCVFLVGIPMMLSEFVLGRGTHKNARGAVRAIDGSHSPYRYASYLGIGTSVLILGFYCVVSGWIMSYVFSSLTHLFTAPEAGGYAERFAAFTAETWAPLLWTFVFLAINLFIISRGVEKGIERCSNILMPLLFLIMVVFCVNSLMMSKANEGLAFLFSPDFSQLTPSTIIGAMGQAFFTLSLGMSCMLTYSSYFTDSTKLIKNATITAILDTVVALMAGIIIFPAVFTYGMEPTAGPRLVFGTLPGIFAQMPGGNLWSLAFFVLLLFASLTSTISMSEIPISYLIEERKMKRGSAAWLITAIVGFLAIFSSLSFGVLSDFKIFGLTVFDFLDYVTANIMMPIAALSFALLVGWKVKREWVLRQLDSPWGKPAYFCIRYIAPIAVIAIFVYGIFFA